MAVADKVSTVLTWSLRFRYQMLDRMKQDCEYFLGHGNRATKYLCAGSVAAHFVFLFVFWWCFLLEVFWGQPGVWGHRLDLVQQRRVRLQRMRPTDIHR